MLGHGRAFVFAFLATMLLVAGPAWGEQRFVAPSPTGQAAGTCTAAEPPCTLEWAVETVAQPGDEVIVSPGDYNEGSDELTITDPNLNVHGAVGQPRPRIVSSAVNEAVDITPAGARLADLTIEYSGTNRGLFITNATAERLFVKSGGTAGCTAIGATLRDSVCWSTGSSGRGIVSNFSGGTVVTTVRNVTAVATGANSVGIEIITQGATTNHTLDAKNVIADGVDNDVEAEEQSGSTTAVNLAYSNFATSVPSGGATATPPGSPTNQTAPPAFVDAPNGDFHQAAGSPTIDAGTGDSQLGSADIDGEARSQGAVPDIGADEFVPTLPPAANGDNFPPDTKILKGPKKRTKKRKAKFQFGGSEPGLTFECSLDEKAFKPCHSPKKFRSLKRTKHVFAVRAVDAAGNRDPTPADRKWSIKKKKRRK
jgi:hypothetical protein